VHRKEVNVSQEKMDFEDARKNLEARLKEIKRELEALESAEPRQELSDGLGRVSVQITRYQNKVP
jgi:hypothetical protein